MSDSIPKGLQSQASKLVRGRKRQRVSGGNYRNLGRQPHVRELPKGDFVDPGITIVDTRPAIAQCPISSHAEDLLESYHRRASFWWAVRILRTPVEWAGMIHLGVKKRRAYEVLEELEEWDSPHEWFQDKALEGFQSGQIGPGRAMLPSGIADAFFTALAGGVNYVASLRNDFGARSRIDLRGVLEQWDELNCEIIDYMVYSRLFWRQ